MTSRTFPADFLWGVAHAGHQVEGDNVGSDTWFAEQVTPSVFQEPSGKACNNWELWREDIDLAKGMGLTAYRFSVEWSRVEPVEGKVSEEALDHYEAIVDRCLEVGLAPVVTFNHFTSPHWFAMRGSWLDPAAPGAVRALLRRGDGALRRPDRLRRHDERAQPGAAAQLDRTCPDFVRDLERATLEAASTATGVPRYVSNVKLRGDGRPGRRHDRWPPAGKAASRRAEPDLPVGPRSPSSTTSWSATTRPCATASGPRSTSAGSSWPGATTSSASRTTSACRTTATAQCRPRRARRSTRWGRGRAALTGRSRALRARVDRRTGPGDRARDEHRRRHPPRGVPRAVAGRAARP